MTRYLLTALTLGWITCLLLTACSWTASTREMQSVDSLNAASYALRFKNLSLAQQLADTAYNRAESYRSGRAEASNHLGFCKFMKMDFNASEQRFKEVYSLSNNELQLLIADIGFMKIYQRTSQNKEFYDYRNSARARMKRIIEDQELFMEQHERMQIRYAFSEFHIVSAIYYYYLQQKSDARTSLRNVSRVEGLEQDVAQQLYYQYIKASTGLIEEPVSAEKSLVEFDELNHIRRTAHRQQLIYIEANALQELAELMSDSTDFAFFRSARQRDVERLEFPIDSLLPLHLAQQALERFIRYDDPYQVAGAYVSIAKYLNNHGCYGAAIDSLTQALHIVKTHPNNYELTSRIHEQRSVGYAGLGMKIQSDEERNNYLDILNTTRQDKELESRYQSLEQESGQLNAIFMAFVLGIILLAGLLYLFNNRSKQRSRRHVLRLRELLEVIRKITSAVPDDAASEEEIQQSIDSISRQEDRLLPTRSVLDFYRRWTADNANTLLFLSDERRQLEKQRYIYEQHIADHKRQNVVKKTCLAIVNGVNPYIDRIANEIKKLGRQDFINHPQVKQEKFLYIDELITTINRYNDILALWIKMKQGELSLNIENFALNDLFLLVGKGRKTFEQKQQHFQIHPTQAIVKADRALTLFMINTLTENARKYTQAGGDISLQAFSTEDYVEISVEDNGRGLSAEDITTLLSEKIYDSTLIGQTNDVDEELQQSKGSGFGLMNCKGIIEKYRKTDALFQVCRFYIESCPGKGSRFSFRLPVGVKRALLICLCLFSGNLVGFTANADNLREETLLRQASAYADSAYFSNVQQSYRQALVFIDSAMVRLNQHQKQYAPCLRPLKLRGTDQPAELTWWSFGYNTDYHIILDIRNEAAVAFLALKQWKAYNYNNVGYTSLYKVLGEDTSLEEYCKKLEQSTMNKTVGLILCGLIVLMLLLGYYFIYYRKRMLLRLNLEQVLEINKLVVEAASYLPETEEAQKSQEALQLEESALKDIPQHIVEVSFDAFNELFLIDRLYMSVYNKANGQLDTVCTPHSDSKIATDLLHSCFNQKQVLHTGNFLALPLAVDTDESTEIIGVLCIEKQDGNVTEADRLLLELIGRFVSVVVFNSVVRLAGRYRNIEAAHEEARRASREDTMLHIQNMVLDNCLSTIKHETIYYPNKMKQIILKLREGGCTPQQERDAVEAMAELIDYYKGIYALLSSCAARQLEEVTFRRSTLPVEELLQYAEKYFKRQTRNRTDIRLETQGLPTSVIGDRNELQFLLENLINEALSNEQAENLFYLTASQEADTVRFRFCHPQCEKSVDELNRLFYPEESRMEFLICKQIIRDHDEFAGRRGCRINAEPMTEGGYCVYFTLPCK